MDLKDFFRAAAEMEDSKPKETGRKPANEIRRQVQVYLAHPMEGW